MTALRELLPAAAGTPRIGIEVAQVRRRARSMVRRRRAGAATVVTLAALAVLVCIRAVPEAGPLSGPAPLPATGPVQPGEFVVGEFVPPLELTIPGTGFRVQAKSWGGVTLTHRDGIVVVSRWSSLVLPPGNHTGERSAVSANLLGWLRRDESLAVSPPVPVMVAGRSGTQVDLMVVKATFPAPEQCDPNISCVLLAADPNGWLWLGSDERARLIVLLADLGASGPAVFVKSRSEILPRFLEEVAPLLESLDFPG